MLRNHIKDYKEYNPLEVYTTVKELVQEDGYTVKLVKSNKTGDEFILRSTKLDGASKQEIGAKMKNIEIFMMILKPEVILKTQETFVHGGALYSVHQTEGDPLKEKIKSYKDEGKLVPEDQVIDWLTQALLALSEFHSKNLLVGDLNPGNIFLTKDLKVKFSEFGAMKEIGDLDKKAGGQNFNRYAAPELSGGVGFAQKADIWALGCTFFEVLAQKPAFGGDATESVVDTVRSGDLEKALPEAYSEELRQIVVQMLNLSPFDRPSSASLLKNEFLKESVAK